MRTDVTDTFHAPCLTCGSTVTVAAGVEQPHACEPAADTAARIADAYWNGHDAATTGGTH